MRTVAYYRVSTEQQGESGAGLEAQASRVASEVERQGWLEVGSFTDVGSGGTMKRRPKLSAALTELKAGEADLLVVAKLDRLSRSLLDFANLMARAQREGWGIVALDINVDTSTVNGELMANIIMSLAQWERRIIGQRTKDALAAIKARGVQLGRPVQVTAETEGVIRLLRQGGQSYGHIARLLNDNGVPTAQGGARWYPSTIQAIERRLSA